MGLPIGESCADVTMTVPGFCTDLSRASDNATRSAGCRALNGCFRRGPQRTPACRRAASWADAMGRLHVVLHLHVLLKRDPFLAHIDLPTPGADLDQALQETQATKNPQCRHHHSGRHDDDGERFKPKLL